MGASESKLVFKQGIFRLQEATPIAPDDPYWAGFWQLPDSTEDVFTLFSSNDIRRTRDENLPNLETLLLAVTSRLFFLRRHASFPHPELAPERDALNCIRILTRLLPFIYETEQLNAWTERFFWASRRQRVASAASQGNDVLFDESHSAKEQAPPAEENEATFEDAKPLAEELLDTLQDLLFYTGFTVPLDERSKARVNYSIWTSGVGCNTAAVSNAHLESNRTEVMRLIITLASDSMYTSPNLLPVKGSPALTYLTTCSDKQVVLSMLCSFLNTTIKFNPASWRIPYDHVVVGDPKHAYIACCLQLLLVLLLYPVPESNPGKQHRNNFRHFLGRLHRPQDFQFISDGMARTLNQPLQTSSSYLPGSQKPIRWAPEMIMLFWEMIQCNKHFRAFIVDTDRGFDFLILILFYAISNRLDLTRQGIVRMCVFILQTLSVEETFGPRLNVPFQRPETLPPAIKIDNWTGSYGDFLIVSIHTLIAGSKGQLDAVYPALLAIINNISASLENLNALSCLKLLQLFSSMSSPSFLLANETNHELLASLLEALNSIIEHKYTENRRLATAVVRTRRRFEALRTLTLESGQKELERMRERRKDSARDGNQHTTLPRPRSDSNEIPHGAASARHSNLTNVPEEGAQFAIGEDESESGDTESAVTPSASSPSNRQSRTPSISSSVDSAVPVQVRGMSEKARGKMPVGTPTFSRVNSMSSMNSYTSLSANGHFTPSPQWIESWLPMLPLHTILTLLSASTDTTPPKTLPNTIERSPPRIHSFEWSPLALGWYESLLWSCIFASEMIVERGTVGVWNGTNIRLFKVEKETERGPSLLKPKGAVDAVGSSIVQRIGSLNLRGNAAGERPPEAAARTQSP